jgi:uncharacterized membrane protein YgaE (UPF0421/DUF939 family)
MAPRAAARSRASARTRARRLASRALFIVQCGLGAGLAWWFASAVMNHPTPFFAPVTAIICLGMSYGQRLQRVGQVMVGVAVGVFVGDLFVHVLGSGVWQLMLVVILAMGVAAFLGAGLLLVTQAGVQSAIVTTLIAQPGQAFSRWIDAVVGGCVALLFTLVAPAAPIRRPRQQAAVVVREISAILADTVAALRDRDSDLVSATLSRARASESMLDELRRLSAEGIAVVRLSPFRRRHLPGVQAIADLLEPLDRAIRNLRVLVRRAAVAAWRDEQVPTAYLMLLTALAGVTADGQLQLNAYEPLAGISIMESQQLLHTGSATFRTKCVDGIDVNEKVLARYMETTVGIVTALNPVIGYDKATELANEAYSSGKGLLEIIREKKILTEEQIKDLLDPVKLANLDKSKYPK